MKTPTLARLRRTFDELDSLCRALPVEHIRWSSEKGVFYVCLATKASAKFIGAAPTLADAFNAACESFCESLAREK
jgi:hypothetical protein